jgi:hypothetical protein
MLLIGRRKGRIITSLVVIIDLRPDSFDVQADAVDSGLGAHIKRTTVVVAEREVMRVLGTNNRAKMFRFGRKNPDPPRTRDIDVVASTTAITPPGALFFFA